MDDNTRSICNELILKSTCERVFRSLITPSEIMSWWQASNAIVLGQENGIWIATWGDKDAPSYIVASRIAVFDEPNLIVQDQYQYKSPNGPLPFDAELATQWKIADEQEGACKLTVTQSGFPTEKVADEFYKGCQQGWEKTLADLKIFVESTTHNLQ